MSPGGRRAIAWGVALAGAGTAAVLACGPFFSSLLTVSPSVPANLARYSVGELGVVKPAFQRRYLVQAYRVLGGAPPLAPDVRPDAPAAAGTSPFERWRALQTRELPPAVAQTLKLINPEHIGGDYSSFRNCLDSAFAGALDAYGERAARYGARSRDTLDWLTAQAAVFQNCGAGPLVLPPSAAFETDERTKADRDYQTAAAYFYATQYDEAAGRFRAIASNAASPWRPLGRYLAARALIRSVTVPTPRPKDAAQRLAAAERDLQATLADRDAAPLHASARGLVSMIATRARPVERLHELSARLATAPTVAPQDLVDYTWLMDRALGESAAGTPPLALADITRGDDMTAWIVATQRAEPQAIERWRTTPSERWLVAALWTAGGSEADLPALLAASGQVPRTSPAFATTAFLRVRALIRRGDLVGARAALGPLPAAPEAGFDVETINLLRAARFMLAGTLDELLANAPRGVVGWAGDEQPDPPVTFDKPAWDDEVAAVFNSRLPLAQLTAAAESTRLPRRLRTRVAQAAFTRAVVLNRAETGRRAAAALRGLAPAMGADLNAYLAAQTDDARRRAGVLAMLRTPGLSINVGGSDDNETYKRDTPFRTFGHAFPSNWWCDVRGEAGNGAARLITGTERPPSPAFLSETDRAAVDQELTALTAAGVPRALLISEAIAWAQTRRTDPDAAEALALAIEGWRWSPCSGQTERSDLPSRAFALLHRQFPESEAAKRTKYWYD